MKLNELFDRPYDYEIVSDNNYVLEFAFKTDKGLTYTGEIMKSTSGIAVSFSLKQGSLNNMAITKTGDSYKVYSTIIKVVKDYVSHHHPKMIMFSSDEPSRSKLYKELAIKASRELPGYTRLSQDRNPDGSTTFMLMREKTSIEESTEPEEFRQILKIFLPFAQKIIKLDKLPTIILRKKIADDHQPTHGRFYNEQYVLEVAVGNRQPVDILRTIAHELVHAKQQREGVNIDPTTGSPDENEANVVAGIVMRHFNKAYPEYLELQPLAEGTNNGRKRICR